MSDTFTADAVVVGGGLAGGAVATLLAQAGRRVTLLEKTRGPHDKVCGEFLSAEALLYLRRLGVDPARLGALPITTLRFTRGSHTTEELLPFPAMSLTRRVLDEALLKRAVEAGATVCRGISITSLAPEENRRWTASSGNGHHYTAPNVFLATGKHDLRGYGRPSTPSLMRHNDLLAFNMYFRVPPRQAELLRSTIEVYLFHGGYCGLQLVEDGTANLGLLVRREQFSTWPALLAGLCRELPQFAERLQAAEQTLPKPLALSHIPYGYRHAATPEGLWVLGDQAAVIPSFSGDGMSIALHSGITAARMLLDGLTAQTFQRELYRQLRTPVTLATVVSRLLVGAPALTVALRRIPGLTRQIALRTRVPLPVSLEFQGN